jgi:outer membrane protein OmpA-like peptidoglycan-associated protein
MAFKKAAFMMLALPTVTAAQPVVGPYVSLGAGGNLQQNEIVPPTHNPTTSNFKSDVIYTFHPGFAGRVATGYGIGHGLRLEMEGDYLDNVVRGAQETLPDGTTPPRRGGGVEQKYGGFVNVLYDADFGLPVYPFIGVGAGGLEVQHNGFNQSLFNQPPLAPVTVNAIPPGTRLGFHEQSVGGFAYQGIAGFSVPLPWVPGLSLTAEYHFIGLLDPLPAYQLTTTRVVEVNGVPTSGPIILPIAYTKRIAFTENRHFTNDYNHELLLGVRYALFQPPPPPPPATVSAPAAPPPAPIPVARTYLVFFDWDRADLTSRARQIVAQAASAVQAGGIANIEVNGYTDLSGTVAYNQRLSVRRAVSVKAELVRDGVPAGEIETIGRGESNPLVPTAAGVREPQNRRVEIILK